MSPVDNTPTGTVLGARKQPARTDNRLRELERTRVKSPSAQVATSEQFPGFSAPGLVADGTVMPRWYANLTSHSFTVLRLSAVTAPAGSEFHLSVDGTTIGVFTLAANTQLYAVTFTLAVGSFLGGTIVTGGGAQNWSAQLEESL